MSKHLVPDELWEAIEPLLPPKSPKPKGGRHRLPDHACLTCTIFVLRTGLPWEDLPKELGRSSGMTCWRLLRNWLDTGARDRLHLSLTARIGAADQIDWERACLHSASVPTKRGASRPKRARRTAAIRALGAILWSTAAPRSRRS